MSFGNNSKRTYEDFKQQIPDAARPTFDRIRDFCFSLGDNVIEDVRMHRIVFCKSMTFRWFADVEPQQDTVALKINRGRKEEPATYEISADSEPEKYHKIIKEAYKNVK